MFSFTRADSGILSEPFAFLRSGDYAWRPTGLGNRSAYGGYWSATTYYAMLSYYQTFYSASFVPQTGYYKGYGFTVRCFRIKSDKTDRKPVALAAPILRIEARRVEALVVRVRGRVSMRRPVDAVRTPTVKASRVPVIDATMKKRKRFGDNAGIGSGSGIFLFRVFAPSLSRLEEKIFSTFFASTLSMNVGDIINGDSGALSEPFALLRNGVYVFSGSGYYGRGSSIYSWSSLSFLETSSNNLYSRPAHFQPSSRHNKGYGFAVR